MKSLKALFHLPLIIWEWLFGSDQIIQLYYVAPNHKVLAELKAQDVTNIGLYVLQKTFRMQGDIYTLNDNEICVVTVTKAWFGSTRTTTTVLAKVTE